MKRPLHFRHPGTTHPACAATGHVRRFRGTDKPELVTCKRCQKLGYGAAELAPGPRAEAPGA